MAVAFDAASESHTGTSGNASAASFTWNHLPATEQPQGVAAFTFTNANADDATAVSYCGTSLTAVSGGRSVDTAGEPGDCKAWFLGSGVPAGTNPTGTFSQIATAAGSVYITDLAYGDGYWVAVNGSGEVYYAADPSGTWTLATSGAPSGGGFDGVAHGNGYWVAVGYTSTGAPLIRYKQGDPTGSWSGATPGGTTNLLGVAYGNGYWCAVGGSGSIRYKATDPTGSWSGATSGGSGNLQDVAYGDGYWAACGSSGVIRYRATDPTGSWSGATTGTTVALYGIAYGGGYWAVSGGGNVSTTPVIRYKATDPTGSWSGATVNDFRGLYGIAYGDGYWVAAGDAGVRYKATNPTGTWTTVGTTSQQSLVQPVYGRGSWVIAGDLGEINYRLPSFTATRTNNADVMYAVGITLTADYDTQVAAVVAPTGGDGTLAEQGVDDLSPGTPSLRLAGVNSGLSAIVDNPTTPGANNLSRGANSTWVHDIDFGTRVIGVVRETTAGEGNRPVGFSASTSDDVAAVYLAIREKMVWSAAGIPVR